MAALAEGRRDILAQPRVQHPRSGFVGNRGGDAMKARGRVGHSEDRHLDKALPTDGVGDGVPAETFRDLRPGHARHLSALVRGTFESVHRETRLQGVGQHAYAGLVFGFRAVQKVAPFVEGQHSGKCRHGHDERDGNCQDDFVLSVIRRIISIPFSKKCRACRYNPCLRSFNNPCRSMSARPIRRAARTTLSLWQHRAARIHDFHFDAAPEDRVRSVSPVRYR